MAPAIAALTGAGLVALWAWYRKGGVLAFVLPVVLAAGVIWPLQLLNTTPWGEPWLRIGIMVCTGLAIVGLLTGRFFRSIPPQFLAAPALAIGVMALLIAPGAWAAATLQTPLSGVTPAAGPAGASGGFGRGDGAMARQSPANADGGGFALDGSRASLQEALPYGDDGSSAQGPDGPGGRETVNQKLLDYLLANQGSAKFLVATSGSQSAAPIIIATGKPVVAMGGFSGSDPAPTTDQLQQMVASGELRFVLLGGGPGPGGPSSLTTWLQSHASLVDPATYGGSASSSSGLGGPGGAQRLYDCAKAP